MSKKSTITIKSEGHATVTVGAKEAEFLEKAAKEMESGMNDSGQDIILDRMKIALADLITNHWEHIREIWLGSEDAKIAIGVKFTLAGTLESTLMITNLSFSQRFGDEIEETIDLNQGKLPLGDKGGE